MTRGKKRGDERGGCEAFGIKFLASIFPSAVTTWKESAFATHALVAIAIVQVV